MYGGNREGEGFRCRAVVGWHVGGDVDDGGVESRTEEIDGLGSTCLKESLWEYSITFGYSLGFEWRWLAVCG